MEKIKEFIDKVQPRDVIAVIVLVCCFIMLFNGKDGLVTAVTTAIIGYYFSKRVYEENNRKN